MTTRVLPPDEWHRLRGTEADTVVAGVDPSKTTVLVVEQGDAVVGCWMLVDVPHVECLWIAPTHRKATAVGRRLWIAMRELATARGLTAVYTAAVSDEVLSLLARVGAQRIEADHYVMPMRRVGGRSLSSCQP